jgi:hypothetical protein
VGKLQVEGSPIDLDPARLQRFIDDVVLPFLQQKLAAAPISPSVFNVLSFQVELKQIQVADGNLRAYVDGHKLATSGDDTPPDTWLTLRPGPVVGPQVVRLRASGADDTTPTALLRYRARLDRGPWSKPAYGSQLSVTASGGTHVVEVAAVDHQGNADPTPTVAILRVDDVMPTLTITGRPDHITAEQIIEVGFTGSDDRTPAGRLVFTAKLFRVPEGGGNPAEVTSRTLAAGATSVSFGPLADGVYKVRVIVADGAGNVTSRDVGFVVDARTGCNAAGSAAPLTALLWLLALAGLLLARRCR